MRIRVLLIVLSLFCTSWAVAQEDAKKDDTEKKATEAKAKESDGSKDEVYTKEHLRKQADESVKSPSVIYNENLKKKPAGGSDTPAIVFTNETLTQRYGDPEPAPEPQAGTTKPSPGGTGDQTADPNAEPGAEPEAEPAMSPAERTKRVAEIETQIERLEKRTLAIKNPFLAGTVPPTDEERTNEKGLNNPERLQGVESQIAELKAELAELQSGK